MSELVLYERRGPVVWLTIDRPEVHNALNRQVIEGLTAGIQRAEQDAEARAIVLTGAGQKAFCAGADLQPKSRQFDRDFSRVDLPLVRLIAAASASALPIIARVNGHCLAGGMGVMAMCDMAIASATAKLGLPEVKIGLFPLQVDAVLQRLIPRRKLVEMSITGEFISADEALEMGLLNYVVPPEELDAKLDWLLARILDKSPTAIRLGKHAMETIADMPKMEALTYMAQQLGIMALTRDAAEGLQARAEKRAPVWTNR